MKRIQTACLHQIIHFQLKDSVPAGMSIQPGDMVQLLRPLQSAK